MKVNIEYLKAKKWDNGCVELVIKERGAEREKSFVMLKEEAAFLVQDNLPVVPCFRDITHFCSFYGDCMVYLEAPQYSPAEWRYWYAPREVVQDLVRTAIERGECSISESSMRVIAFRNRPRCKVVWQDAGILDWAKETMRHFPNVELKKHLTGLVKWARNQSTFGDLVTLHISDDRSTREHPSFYWYMLNDKGQRIINGGLIWHASLKADGSGAYSIHT